MEDLGPPHFDDADKDFAGKIRATLTDKDIASVYYAIGMEPTDRPLADFLVPIDAKRNPLIGSTDVGDVSWVVPTVQVHAPTVAIGTPFHTWQVVAQGKTPGRAQGDGAGRQGDGRPRRQGAAGAGADRRRQGRPRSATTRTPYVSPLPAQCCTAVGYVDCLRSQVCEPDLVFCKVWPKSSRSFGTGLRLALEPQPRRAGASVWRRQNGISEQRITNKFSAVLSCADGGVLAAICRTDVQSQEHFLRKR